MVLSDSNRCTIYIYVVLFELEGKLLKEQNVLLLDWSSQGGLYLFKGNTFFLQGYRALLLATTPPCSASFLIGDGHSCDPFFAT